MPVHKSRRQTPVRRLRALVSPLLGLTAFLCVLYGVFGFQFGGYNNVEELPLVYERLGWAAYPGDPFVQHHANTYTQVTPFVWALSTIADVFRVQDLRLQYFVLHLLTILLMYAALRSILTAVAAGVGEAAVALWLVALLLIDKSGVIVPSGRWIFSTRLDPELVAYPLMYWAVAGFVRGRPTLSTLTLTLALTTLVHPLYALPTCGALLVGLVGRWRSGKQGGRAVLRAGSLYILGVLPYSLFLLWHGRAPEAATDVSLIAEIVRSPHHYQLPVLWGHIGDEGPFLVLVPLVAAAVAALAHRANRREDRTRLARQAVWVVFLSLAGYLAIASLGTSFVRIPVLIRLAPYRIGSLVVVLGWLLLGSEVLPRRQWRLAPWTQWVGAVLLCLLFPVLVWRAAGRAELLFGERTAAQASVVAWISANTAPDDLFLNYTNIDVRTSALRPGLLPVQDIPERCGGPASVVRASPHLLCIARNNEPVRLPGGTAAPRPETSDLAGAGGAANRPADSLDSRPGRRGCRGGRTIPEHRPDPGARGGRLQDL